MATRNAFRLNPGRVTSLLRNEVAPRALFLAFFFIVWEAIARFVIPGLIPTVGDVVVESGEILAAGEFGFHMMQTIRRVLISFVAVWVVSIAIGLAMGLSSYWERFFDIGILIGLTLPGLALAIIAVMIFGLSEVGAYAAIFIAVLPLVTLNFWEGVKDVDMDLVEMGEVFDFGTYETIRHVIIPQLIPYMLSAGRYGLGLSWKLAVIVEFLGFGNGIGYMLVLEYNRFNMAGVFAWTGLFTFVMLIIEYGGFKTVERRYLAWRPTVEIRGDRA